MESNSHWLAPGGRWALIYYHPASGGRCGINWAVSQCAMVVVLAQEILAPAHYSSRARGISDWARDAQYPPRVLTVAITAMSGKEADAKGPGWSVESKAFKSIPAIDTQTARNLLPDLAEDCQMLGKTQSLAWGTVCVAWATVVCQLSPQDIVEICECGTARVLVDHLVASGLREYVRSAQSHTEGNGNWFLAPASGRLRPWIQHEVQLPAVVSPLRLKGLAGGGSLASHNSKPRLPHGG